MSQVDPLPKLETILVRRHYSTDELKVSIERRNGTVRHYKKVSIRSVQRLVDLACRGIYRGYWVATPTYYGLGWQLWRPHK